MKQVLIFVVLLSLTGCASEPMTPEQRAIAMQYLMARAAQPPPPQPAPYYMPTTPSNPPVNCISNRNGNQTYTTCN